MQAPAHDDDDPDKGLVGRKIRAAREALGLSQADLANRLGIDRRQLSEWERGIWEPNRRNLRRLAIALGQPRHYFFTDDA